MKKFIYLTLCTVLLFYPFCLAVEAGTYHDPMRETVSDSVRGCQGLRASQRENLPDPDYLTFQNMSPQGGGAFGTVTYQVSGAETVSVGLYTYAGTFYLYNDVDYPEYPGYILGVVNSERLVEAGQARSMVGLGADGQYSIYAQIGGTRHRLYYHRIENVRSAPRMFLPEPPDAKEPTGLRPYGLTVWSSDGTKEVMVSMSRVSMTYYEGLNYCYEEFQGSFTQDGISQVRVELNDVMAIAWSDGTGQVNTRDYQAAALGSVTLSGKELRLGPSEAVRPESEDPDTEGKTSSKNGADTKSPASSKVAVSVASSSLESKSSSKISSSAKFSGSVAVSSSRDSSGKASSSKAEQKAKIIYSMEPPLDLEPVATPAVYQMEQPEVKTFDLFGVAIAAYLTVMAGMILFVIIRAYGKK